MNNYLESILKEKGFKKIEKENFNMWGNDFEFFILKELTEKKFLSFFNDEEWNSIISEFQGIGDNKIIKNTSLLVLINVDDLEDFYRKNLNQIMQIEEDVYYFRKYILLYTDKGLSKIKQVNTQFLLDYIQMEEQGNYSYFEKFENNMFFDETYFIAMQLIIKLPFISIPHSSRRFEMIEDRIKLRIKEEDAIDNEKKVNRILERLDYDDIGQVIENKQTLNDLDQILGDEFYED